LRDRYEEIQGKGAEVVAIGTGNATLARHFVEDEKIPFPVLVDDEAEAADAASVSRVFFAKLFHPASYAGTRRAWQGGHRIGIPGKRTNQLGATFVIGAGDRLRYEHQDAHTADHAPIDEVLGAVTA